MFNARNGDLLAATAVWPGDSYPLGASYDGAGTNFGLFSEVAERVELCLFDDDGNERAGVILPELAVPLFTHLGFNPRAEPGDGPLGLLDLVGTSLPLPATVAERARTNDPRRAIEERYAGAEDYLAQVGRVISGLVEERLLLASDAAVVLDRAARHYTEITARS